MGKIKAFIEAKSFEEKGKALEAKLKKDKRKMNWKSYNEQMEHLTDVYVSEAATSKKRSDRELIHNTSKEVADRYAFNSGIRKSYFIK